MRAMPRGHAMKTRQISWLVLGLVAGYFSSAAFAFQETTQDKSETRKAAPEAQLDTSGTGTSISREAPSGIEVRIPGLGKLGVLPKFDFGLELLYGLNESKGAGEQNDRLRPSEDDSPQIRGTLKHRF